MWLFFDAFSVGNRKISAFGICSRLKCHGFESPEKPALKGALGAAKLFILWQWPPWVAQIMWQQFVESCRARTHCSDIQLLSSISKYFRVLKILTFFVSIEKVTFQWNLLVEDGRIPTFNPGVLLRALPSSAKSGNATFKNWITLVEEENIFPVENKIFSWAAEP